MIRITRGYSLGNPADAAMFEDRKRLFVDLMRWDVPVIDQAYEIDQFDGPSATYIVDGDGEHGGRAHRGSMRLLPTTGPHILGELFPALAVGCVPQGDAVHEITRLCLPTRLGAPERLQVRNRLISAMVDHALASGIITLTGVVRPAFRETVLAMGWRAAPLGPVLEIGGQKLAAFRIEIDHRTPGLLAATGIYVAGTCEAMRLAVAA
ncbi:MAG: acyl-homoserine-lactone synthase [Sphingomonas sp.]